MEKFQVVRMLDANHDDANKPRVEDEEFSLVYTIIR